MKKISMTLLPLFLTFAFIACQTTPPEMPETTGVTTAETTVETATETTAVTTAETATDTIATTFIETTVEITDKTPEEAAKAQALALADHFITYVLTENWLEDDYNPTEKDIYQFLLTMSLYRENNDHPYVNMVTLSEDEMWLYISLTDAQVIANQLFAYPSWDQNSYPVGDSFDETEQCYWRPYAVDLWASPFGFKNMTADIKEDCICVSYTLVNSDKFEYPERNYGDYEFIFQCVNSNEESYLQFIEFKVKSAQSTSAESIDTAQTVTETTDSTDVSNATFKEASHVEHELNTYNRLYFVEGTYKSTIEFDLPQWYSNIPGVYQDSKTNPKQKIELLYLKETNFSENLRDLCAPTLRHAYIDDIKTGENYLIIPLLPVDNYTYLYRCAIRLSEYYVLLLNFYSDKQAPSSLYDFIDNVVLSEEPLFAKVGEKPSFDTMKKNEIHSLQVVDEYDENHVGLTEMPENAYLTLDLPAAWNTVSEDVLGAFSATLFLTTKGLCPEKCAYFSFRAHSYYFTSYGNQPFWSSDAQLKTSASSAPYTLFSTKYPQYHAVVYSCNLQVSEDYILSFDICTDADDTDLIYQIIDSIKFYI